MEQTKALDALEPFLALTKSATTARQAADLVTRATSAPNTYLFTELLRAPQIQSLSTSPEYSPYLTLLQIFSHGTYASYTATPNLPALTAAQALKLRQLTLLSLARDRVLSYPALIAGLGLSSARELEDVVTSSIYASLLHATLDPARATVHVHSVAPLRDVSPDAVPDLLSSLRAWAARCDAALADLDTCVRAVRAAAGERARARAEWDARVDRLVEDESKAANVAGGGGAGGFGAAEQGSAAAGGLHHAAHQHGLPGRTGQSSRHIRYGKRGSGHMDAATEDVDDEAMDLDEEDEGLEGKKRTSRRKLQG